MGPYAQIGARSGAEARHLFESAGTEQIRRSSSISSEPHYWGREPERPGAKYATVASFKHATVLDAPEATLVDIGDGVACLEFHSKMNTFSPPMTAFVDQARERAERDFRALVIANDAVHFSAGYNLNLFL